MLGRVRPVISEAQRLGFIFSIFSILRVQTDCWPSSGRQAQTKSLQALPGSIFLPMKLGQRENSKQLEEGKKYLQNAT